ncbi:MAG TPA: hypothetical protein VD994_01940, partial [Prosthecobacter sp.]|nr:hypothetical protein [Prosthecobacter sp.]
MGLDTVELILTVEKTFDVEVPNYDAEKMSAVADLHGFIVPELAVQDRPRPADQVWEQLVGMLVR